MSCKNAPGNLKICPVVLPLSGMLFVSHVSRQKLTKNNVIFLQLPIVICVSGMFF